MRWILASLGLLSVLMAGALWVALRDWQPPPRDAPAPGEAAARVRQSLGCADCDVSVRGRTGTDQWTMAVKTGRRERCLHVDLSVLGEGPGLRGVARVRC
jgi:hypothetical protein